MITRSPNLQYALMAYIVAWTTATTWGGNSAVHISGRVPEKLPSNTAVPVVISIPTKLAVDATLVGHLSIGGKPAGEVILQTEQSDEITDTPARAWFAHTFTSDQAGKPIDISIAPGPALNGKAASSKPVYNIEYADPLVEIITPQGKPVLSYRHGKPDPALKYPMTSYIHPLVGLDGEILTDCSPKDHYHQRGLFWAWVRIQKGDQTLGDWWQPKGIELDAKYLNTTNGPVFARFIADHDYVYQPSTVSQPTTGVKPGERLFNERVVCRVFQTTSAGRAIDIDLTITALQDGMKIGGQTELGKGYGGMTLRFGRSPDGKGQADQPRIIADGHVIEEETVNHLKALWVDWTGMFLGPDGKRLSHRSGGAIFVHPSHPPLPNSPPEWITRAYGPINVAYPNLAMLDVPKHKPLRLRYRIWLHREDAIQADVGNHYRAYATDWMWANIEKK